MLGLVRKHPFVSYALLSLLLAGVLHLMDARYDGGGLSSLLVITSFVWLLIFILPYGALSILNNGERFYGQEVLAVVLALVVCAIADYLLFGRKNECKIAVNKLHHE